MRDLLRTLYASAGSWRAVAALLTRIGGVSKSDVWWLQLAAGNKMPTRQDVNAVRRCFPGWPDVPPTAVEVVGALNILEAVVADKNPDTAVLLRTDGAHIVQVLAKVSDTQPTDGATSLATFGSITTVKRRERQPVHVFRLSTMDAQGLETVYRKSGNLAAIAAAASLAALYYKGE